MESLFSYVKGEDDDLYFILGCGEHSSEEQILAEYKLKALECHPDKNPDDPKAVVVQKYKFENIEVHTSGWCLVEICIAANPSFPAVFAKINKAKEILTDTKKRKEYDKWRHSEIPMAFDQWIQWKDTMHTSMHWAMKTKSEPMIEAGEPSHLREKESWPGGFQWESDSTSEALRKFRNYEI